MFHLLLSNEGFGDEASVRERETEREGVRITLIPENQPAPVTMGVRRRKDRKERESKQDILNIS